MDEEIPRAERPSHAAPPRPQPEHFAVGVDRHVPFDVIPNVVPDVLLYRGRRAEPRGKIAIDRVPGPPNLCAEA